MKICWDNLEGIRLTRNGNFIKRNNTYLYKDCCKECGEPYLTQKSNNSNFCSIGCAQTGERNNHYNKKLNGKNNPAYKHGLINKKLANFNLYAPKLDYTEEVKNIDGVLAVKCSYCGRWFIPKLYVVIDRIRFLEGKRSFESKFYCSKECKISCPIYNVKKWPRGFKKSTSREVQSELRKLVLKRDNYICQKCGKTINEIELHCHHIESINKNPIESADVDNCITLCKECHKEVHRLPGCNYYELRCNTED